MLVKIDDKVPDVDSVLIYMDDTHSSYIETKDGTTYTVVGARSVKVEQDRDVLILTIE